MVLLKVWNVMLDNVLHAPAPLARCCAQDRVAHCSDVPGAMYVPITAVGCTALVVVALLLDCAYSRSNELPTLSTSQVNAAGL